MLHEWRHRHVGEQGPRQGSLRLRKSYEHVFTLEEIYKINMIATPIKI